MEICGFFARPFFPIGQVVDSADSLWQQIKSVIYWVKTSDHPLSEKDTSIFYICDYKKNVSEKTEIMKKQKQKQKQNKTTTTTYVLLW